MKEKELIALTEKLSARERVSLNILSSSLIILASQSL